MYLSVLFIFLFMKFMGLTLARSNLSYCYRDNCFRALVATQDPQHVVSARSHCRSILTLVNVTATGGVAIPTSQPPETTLVLPRGQPVAGLPVYASACLDITRYASACSCIGFTGGNVNITMPATTMTDNPSITTTADFHSNSTSTPPPITSILFSTSESVNPSPVPPFTNSSSTASSILPSTSLPTFSNSTSTFPSQTSSTIPSITPTCTADTLIDPMNCGGCGIICDSGTCENGVCTSSQCTAQKCGGFINCNDNTNCFCFSSANAGNGFCGSNAVCTGLTTCATDNDCSVKDSTGNICAIQTCCPQESNDRPGVCLEGQCGNPGAKLMMLAKARSLHGRTAAF